MAALYFSGVIIGCFLSFVLLTKSDKTSVDYILACWLAATAGMLMSAYLLDTGLYVVYPSAAIQGLWVPLLQGPFLYLYVKYQTRPILFQKWDLLHFLPFILGYLLFARFYFLSLDAQLNAIEHNAEGFEIENRCRIILIYISGFIYIPLSGYKLLSFKRSLEHQFSNIERINFRWLLYLIIGMAVIWLTVLVFHSDQLVFAAASIFVCWMGYFGIKQVHVFSQKTIESIAFVESKPQPVGDGNTERDTDGDQASMAQPSPKYAKSALDQEAAQKIHTKLLEILEKQKPYLDPELTLNDLADMVGTNPNLLSQVINSVEQKNFYDLVNELRVKEFLQQVMLPANKKYTLLTVAYDCGFNSKASFNRNFKKHMGKSPREYLSSIS